MWLLFKSKTMGLVIFFHFPIFFLIKAHNVTVEVYIHECQWQSGHSKLMLCLYNRDTKWKLKKCHCLYSRMSAACDTDRFVVHLQTDGTGELALQAFPRCGCCGSILLLMLPELSSRHKTAEHRHHEHGPQDEPLILPMQIGFLFNECLAGKV